MVLLASLCVVVQAEEKYKDGFISIFDGKTLKGWEAMPADNRGRAYSLGKIITPENVPSIIYACPTQKFELVYF